MHGPPPPPSLTRVWVVGRSKSLRSLVTRKPKEAHARHKPDSKEAALKELEGVASALKRATTAVRRKSGAGEKDLEHALKAEGISAAQVGSPPHPSPPPVAEGCVKP